MADVNEEVVEETAGEEEEVEVETDEFGNPVEDEESETDAEDEGADEDKDSDSEGDEDAEGGEDDGDSDSDADDPAVDPRDAEIASLRQMGRALRQELRDVNAKLEKQGQALVDKDILEEEEVDEEQAALQQQRDAVLNEMVEMMELNPKFEDVKEVCSQDNCDDVVEMLANAYVAENGGKVDEVYENLYGVIWSKPNPYKELYGLVKQHHPRYNAETSNVDADAEGEKPKPKKPKSAAPSLSDVDGGDSKNSTGWTSARIDAMSEDELEKVPADVYDKYMRGTLD